MGTLQVFCMITLASISTAINIGNLEESLVKNAIEELGPVVWKHIDNNSGPGILINFDNQPSLIYCPRKEEEQ